MIVIGENGREARTVLYSATDLTAAASCEFALVRRLDAKLGRIEPVVERMIQSVLRNPGALSCLGRVKQKDHYTFEHSVNVSVLLVNFCHHLGLNRRTTRDAAIGG